jgi:drug/metabolite transporter (DMT)-like permease
MWVFFAFLAPALYAIAEIFDGYLSNRGFKNIAPLIFFASLMNFIFVAIIFTINKPIIPTGNLILPLIGVGLTNVLYLYPYYKSLKIEDTSIVSGFFSIGKIIIPILAFIFVGEVLSIKQYIGILIIILGNSFLALNTSNKKITFNKSFYLIILASTILSIEGILFKYMFEQGVDWSTAIGGQLLISGVIACTLLMLITKTRKQIFKERSNYRKSIKIFFTEESITFLAVASETYAISLAPVSLVKGIGMTIPIFVLSYIVIVKKYNPKAFRENIEKKFVFKKAFIFSLIILGLFLIGIGK